MTQEELKKQVKDTSKLISKPSRKIIGGIKSSINILNLFGKNSGHKIVNEKESIFKTQIHNSIKWIDIENPKRKDINELGNEFSFHSLHLEACLLREQLDRVDIEKDYIFILLRVPIYHADKDKIVTNKIYIFLGKDYLITLHDDMEHVLSDLFKKCEIEKDVTDAFFKKSSGYLLYSVLNVLVKDLEDLRKKVLHELEEIDDLVFDTKISGVYEISKLRQRIVRLRRVIGSFRKIIVDLSSGQTDILIGTTVYYKNIANKIIRLWDTLEEARETIEIYKDADYTVSTDRTNKILAVLTVVFTLTIPSTIFGTFYGMNILLPGGLEAGSWTFFGPYTTFYIIVSISIISIVTMYLYFKYKNWF